ncbi:MAG: hypothetical protein A2V52_01880 [Actinobacteria bacterium RBG_19FT_COMBO_54_7]|uniref:Uncharacterized protein n=1 Tax=Candidatus Solincola sediminis TaxID=1797199 RepID=A0A1F2WQL7_9ACTN|nr:MAG: hypothetical protein A2W01_04340 [Candidatus Solincola sediminis]OFW59100.1 MAG: hypothetical protein A2Y75_05065 [Candidatus Solincola sediminis]OFW65663.1 MAG: hypothetical protein A2V52_01880 [Actinobacteria bacterium RBG_19FT_COMBO_54_7]
MDNEQVVELVIVEGSAGRDGLFVLDREYDQASNNLLCLRLFAFDDWMAGRRDQPTYIALAGELVLYERDPSGYISTSKRLKSLEENGKWYDMYGRCYAKCPGDVRLSELKCKLFPLDLMEKLGKEELKQLISNRHRYLTNGSGNITPP